MGFFRRHREPPELKPTVERNRILEDRLNDLVKDLYEVDQVLQGALRDVAQGKRDDEQS